MVSASQAKTLSSPRHAGASFSRCATDGCRCCSGSARRSRTPAAWALPGGYLSPRRDARGVDPPAPRGEGRRARALAPRAARDAQRSRAAPAAWQLATAYLGLVPARRRPGRPRGHGLAPGRRAAATGVRPRGDRARRPRAPARQALVHEPRLRARARRRSRSPSCATSTRPRSGTRCRRRTCSASCSAAACSSRRASAGGPGRAAAARPRLYRFSDTDARDHRPVRSPASADMRRFPFATWVARG